MDRTGYGEAGVWKVMLGEDKDDRQQTAGWGGKGREGAYCQREEERERVEYYGNTAFCTSISQSKQEDQNQKGKQEEEAISR